MHDGARATAAMSTRVSNQPNRGIAAFAAALCLLAAPPATAAGPVWLTVLGDPLDPKADTVQVDVTSAVAFDNSRLVRLRANRGELRQARDGTMFRSYTSEVLIDCLAKTARHRSQVLYDSPLWTGAAHQLTYRDDDVRTVAFRGMEANPKDRIIRAACSIELVESAKPATP